MALGTLELSVLSLLRKKQYYLRYKDLLSPDFFSSVESRTIYKMIRSYHDKGGGKFLTLKNLWILLEKYIDEDDRSMFLRLLHKMKGESAPDESTIHLSIIEFAKRHKVRAMVQYAANQLQAGVDIDVDSLRKRLDEVVSLNGAKPDTDYRYFEQAETRRKEDIRLGRIPTGISEKIDEAMNGGLGAGELGFFLAPPKRGKTLALVNVGANALRLGKKVMHATLEIQGVKVARRYDCCLTKATWWDVVEDRTLIPEMQKKLESIGAELIIKDYSYQHCSVSRLSSLLEREREMKVRPYDLIIVDFADLMTPPEQRENTRQELLRVYQELRILAGHFRVPVWTASQGNRQAVDHRQISMSDIAEAFGKAGIADILIGLSQEQEEREEGLMRVKILASRIGRADTTSVLCTCDTDRMLLRAKDETSSRDRSGSRTVWRSARKNKSEEV